MAKVAEIKTKENNASVEDFINSLKSEEKRKDSVTLIKLMQKATKEKPKMWGSSMVGFGNIRYKSPTSGREVDWLRMGFSPRKTNLSLYLMIDFKSHAVLLERLGKYKTGVGCLYINKLDDVDLKIIEQLINESAKTKQ